MTQKIIMYKLCRKEAYQIRQQVKYQASVKKPVKEGPEARK